MTIDHVKLFLLFAGVFLPGISLAAPPVHQVSGGGTVEYAGALNVHSFAAQKDGDGDVRGQAEFQLRDLKLEVEIGCLSVIDNTAWLGGIIRDATDATLVGQVVLFRVRDNSVAGEEEKGADMTSQLLIGVTVPECGTTPPFGLISWTSGNVSVR